MYPTPVEVHAFDNSGLRKKRNKDLKRIDVCFRTFHLHNFHLFQLLISCQENDSSVINRIPFKIRSTSFIAQGPLWSMIREWGDTRMYDKARAAAAWWEASRFRGWISLERGKERARATSRAGARKRDRWIGAWGESGRKGDWILHDYGSIVSHRATFRSWVHLHPSRYSRTQRTRRTLYSSASSVTVYSVVLRRNLRNRRGRGQSCASRCTQSSPLFSSRSWVHRVLCSWGSYFAVLTLSPTRCVQCRTLDSMRTDPRLLDLARSLIQDYLKFNLIERDANQFADWLPGFRSIIKFAEKK